jgi:anti-sigma-K factor RskA
MSEPSEKATPGDDRIVRAGEIALGLVRRSEIDPALANDPALAREVERWEEVLGELAVGLAPVPPPRRVWATLAQAMTAGGPQGAEPSRPWSVALWRTIAAGSLAAAIVLGVLYARAVVGRAPETASRSGPLLVAALAPKDGPPLFVAAYDAARRSIVVVPASFAPEAGKIAEFWISPKDSDEPIALGRLNPAEPTMIHLSAAEARTIDADTTLAVTIEKDGSAVPPASPGPLIAHGRFATF